MIWRNKITVIAWDGVTLAADKRCVDNGIIRTTTKIFKHKTGLYAVSGCFSFGLAMLEWFTDLNRSGPFPTAPPNTEAFVTHVNPDGKICRYDNCEHPIWFEDPIYACGSGRDFAIGAMECGYNARQAVEVASKHETGCGNGVDTFTLEDCNEN